MSGTTKVNRPGIVLGYTGLKLAIQRLDEITIEVAKEQNIKNEADLVRTTCETLFWLFAVNEDFKKLIEKKTTNTIYNWWANKGKVGEIMNGFQLVRNRVTHDYAYYWEIVNIKSLVWNAISQPSPDELSGKSGKYVPQQFQDYKKHIEGHDITTPLVSIAKVIVQEILKYDLTKW